MVSCWFHYSNINQFNIQTGGDDLISRCSSTHQALFLFEGSKALISVHAIKKSLASASFIRKPSLRRSSSTSPDTPASPRRPRSRQKPVSNLGSKIVPGGCHGEHNCLCS